MRVLALDTTAGALSAAVVEDDRVLAERLGDAARTHAERLPGDLLAVLGEAGVELSSVDVFAVATGPGSFTGLRIGIATMQGLSLVRKRRIVALSALEALAYAAARDAVSDPIVAAWIDAHRRDVFSAVYRIEEAPPFGRARLTELDGPAVGAPSATLARWSAAGLTPGVFIGSGAVLYADLVGEPGVRVLPPPPLAPVIGLAAVARARAGESVGPAGVHPLYVRRPDAEIARENAQPQDRGRG